MQRQLWFRALIAIWGFWFTAALIEAPGVHTCRLHSGAAGSAHVHTMSDAPMHARHVASAGMSHGTAATETDGTGAPTCTCLGSCAAPVAFAAREEPTVFAFAGVVIVRAAELVTDATPALSRPYARPYANGPPTTI